MNTTVNGDSTGYSDACPCSPLYVSTPEAQRAVDMVQDVLPRFEVAMLTLDRIASPCFFHLLMLHVEERA